MRKAMPAGLLVIGIAALVLGLILSRHIQTMPSYLAAWLFIAALPFGALPLVMAADLLNAAGQPSPGTLMFAAPLRRQLLLAPLAALLVIPVLFRVHPLFFHGAHLATPLARAWMAPAHYIIRVILYLIVWTILALIFARPPAPDRPQRPAMAVFGLLLHFIIGAMAATDFAMAVEPKWTSADFGLIFIASQSLIALSFAMLRQGRAWMPATRQATVLLGLVGVWMFLQFTQFLAIWSANMPAEVIWYLHRDAAGGHTIEWIGFIGGFVLPLIILPMRRHAGVAAMAALLLAVQALEMLWLITPSFRAKFALLGIDIIELIGLLGIVIGAALILDAVRPGWVRPRRVRHG
jgi:hypothetical protein